MNTYNQNLCYIMNSEGTARCGPCNELAEGESITGKAPDGTPIGVIERDPSKLPDEQRDGE